MATATATAMATASAGAGANMIFFECLGEGSREEMQTIALVELRLGRRLSRADGAVRGPKFLKSTVVTVFCPVRPTIKSPSGSSLRCYDSRNEQTPATQLPGRKPAFLGCSTQGEETGGEPLRSEQVGKQLRCISMHKSMPEEDFTMQKSKTAVFFATKREQREFEFLGT